MAPNRWLLHHFDGTLEYSGLLYDYVCHSKERPMLAHIACVCMSAATPTSLYTRAAPVVSACLSCNTAATDGGFVTVSGLAFYTSDKTPTVEVGLASCATSVWTSSTSTVCASALAIGPTGLDIAVTADTVVGTQTSIFSFDGHTMLSHCID